MSFTGAGVPTVNYWFALTVGSLSNLLQSLEVTLLQPSFLQNPISAVQSLVSRVSGPGLEFQRAETLFAVVVALQRVRQCLWRVPSQSILGESVWGP